MKKVYCLWFSQNNTYHNTPKVFLGVYSNKETLDSAISEYKKMKHYIYTNRLLFDESKGVFSFFEHEVDKTDIKW